MSRRLFLEAGAGVIATVLLAGCASKPASSDEAAAKRREIDAKVDTTMTRLYTQAPGSKELVDKARGVLVFPDVTSVGLVVGGKYGEGALRVAGSTVGYYKTSGGSFGLTAGAQSQALVLLFMTPEALDKFRAANGWTAGVDASVAVAKAGAGTQMDTATGKAGVIGYALTNSGLMADLSFDGTKVSKLDLGG